MKVLLVTWLAGSWDMDGGQPIETATVPVHVVVAAVGDSIVFRRGQDGSETYLVVPEGRLVSAVAVEIEAEGSLRA